MRNQQIERLQKALDRSVRVLLELKRREGLTKKDRDEIDDTVASMQSLSHKLPALGFSSEKRLIVGVISKFVELWRRFRDSGH